MIDQNFKDMILAESDPVEDQEGFSQEESHDKKEEKVTTELNETELPATRMSPIKEEEVSKQEPQPDTVKDEPIKDESVSEQKEPSKYNQSDQSLKEVDQSPKQQNDEFKFPADDE